MIAIAAWAGLSWSCNQATRGQSTAAALAVNLPPQLIVTRVVGVCHLHAAAGSPGRQLKNNDSVPEGSVIVTESGNTSLQLFSADGSIAMLGSDGELVVDRLGSGRQRPAWRLNRGELIVNIRRGVQNPTETLAVQTPLGAVVSKGTVFRIALRPTGVGPALSFQLSCVEGLVALVHGPGNSTDLTSGLEFFIVAAAPKGMPVAPALPIAPAPINVLTLTAVTQVAQTMAFAANSVMFSTK